MMHARLPKPAVVLLAGLLSLTLPGLACAAPALRPDMVQSLERMQSRLDGGDPAALADDARAAAARLEGGNAADRWARALFLQIAANAERRRDNPVAAAELLAQARSLDGIEREYRRRWLHQEARLRLSADQTARGVELLGQWLEQDEAAADDGNRWLMAQGLAQLERWEAAAEWVDRARRGAGATADGRRLELAASIYQRAGREREALTSLDALLGAAEVTADTWRRAAGLAQRLDHPGRAAAIWEAGWRRGALQGEAALHQLIQLHRAGGTPARAAEHLERALANGQLEDNLANRRLLAQAWSAARDRDAALEAWHAVSERSQKGEDWRQLGELAYAWGRWELAIEALRRARRAGEATPRDWLLEGVSALEQGDREVARAAFEAARQAGAEQAEAWLDSLQSRAAGVGAESAKKARSG
ncbi:hypothetical protein R6258_02350 [Halomonas sp. HP20-15]|uniref:hypothetical protein n=1 Tax=Halomonas sp. HP20-15 TaxID=3085901 RepID=UPI00298154ED|nr:hypothetical protein [Halomonas sp. HP20-15]MDW5375751.1 hypothetical protein [Halomonas sp. HP20-15]